MEMEYFVMPEDADSSLQYWVEQRFQWYLNLGIRPENLRLRWHDSDELAHYAKATADVEYLFPMGWSELEGIANRTDFDLLQHSKTSGKSLTVFDEESKQHITPYVIEPSGGVDRATLAFLVDSYREEEVRGETRVLLKLHKDLCPVQVAVLPLSRNQRLLAPVPAGIRYGPNRFPRPVRRRSVHRAQVQAPGRNRDPALRHRGLRLPRRQRRDHQRPRLHVPVPRPHRPSCRRGSRLP